MKKLFILPIFLSFFIVYCAKGQEKSKKAEIPSEVSAAFNVKYPKAQKVSWGIEKPGEYEAEFTLNGVESSAVFDSKGQFLESETEIKESELPQAVKSVLSKDFAGYKTDETEKSVDARGVATYEMEVSKGKEKFEVSFDANGKLLEKEAVNKDEKEKD